MTKTTSFSTKRLVSDAVFIALYVALSFASVRIGGFKLTIAALPTVLCAVVCGPVDAIRSFSRSVLPPGCSSPAAIRWRSMSMPSSIIIMNIT